MAYADDISALGAEHLYRFDGNANDSIGTVNGTASGVAFTGTPICEDASNSMTTGSTSARLTIPDTNVITEVKSRKAFCGWFMTTAVQQPPTRIYGEGGTAQSISINLGFGNSLLFEVDLDGDAKQIFGDTDLVPNRAYHVALVFMGTDFRNKVECYLDGVRQLDTQDDVPDVTTIAARTPAVFGQSSVSVAIGSTELVQVSPVSGIYNYWAFFDGNDANLSAADVRQELFEKGALPDTTVTSGSQSAMQTQINALASSVRPNKPLCIRINAVSGDGNFTLSANNITFDPLASIHVQYMGTGTLTWINNNGSNASIGSTPNGGTVTFQNPKTITVSDLIAGSEVRIYEAGTTTELGGVETSGTSFALTVSVAAVDVRILSTIYNIKAVKNISMADDVSLVAGQVPDRQYENP